jgi:hypothetical protein
MLRRLVSAVIMLVLCVGITLAAEIRAVITKVDGDKVTFKEIKGKMEFGDEQTLPVAENAKIVKGKRNPDTKKLEAGDAIEGGLKNEIFSKEKLGEKGAFATVITDDDGKKITEIRVAGRGKKKQ